MQTTLIKEKAVVSVWFWVVVGVAVIVVDILYLWKCRVGKPRFLRQAKALIVENEHAVAQWRKDVVEERALFAQIDELDRQWQEAHVAGDHSHEMKLAWRYGDSIEIAAILHKTNEENENRIRERVKEVDTILSRLKK